MPSTPIRSRRALHLPFFPLPSPPPAEPPSSSTPQQPFFPSYPSPPPPQPTLAANISSLTFSGSRSAPPARHTTVVVVAAAVLTPLLALALLAAAAAFFLHRHRHRLRCCPCFDKEGARVPAPAAADLPHHDALVDTRLCGLGEDGVRPAADPTGGAPSCGRRSFDPSRRCRASSHTGVEKNSTKSTNIVSPPLSPPVASSPHVGSSPSHSSGRSLKSTSQRSLAGGLEFTVLPQPPPPPPCPPRPVTPSPPKQKPSLPSPPSSPEERESERKVELFDLAGSNLRSTMILAHSPSPPGAQPQRQAPPPPPLPPPPPTRRWDSQDRESLARKPPIAPPMQIGTKTPPALVNPTHGVEKNKEAPRPKLKPLHWDKVQASSNRAMVWDQLKSSSFR
ncbi:hypothetical protein B296_00036548 [Ensete ventricosum]|uniref:FH2 domain-containing protein n=1 Tax=Ensete ventricosum TaxID=4639 RepID=A0A426YFD7_ENSVE|nr:hypothetical protein B296_00036548 [Ensete ventricosum]